MRTSLVQPSMQFLRSKTNVNEIQNPRTSMTQMRLEGILWIFRRVGFKITENLSLTIIVHNLYWFCSSSWRDQNIVRKVSINPFIHRDQENYVNVWNGWCMATGSDMVKLESVYYGWRLSQVQFFENVVLAKENTPAGVFCH